MASPLSNEHGVMERRLSIWLGLYEIGTPGCQGGNNRTWFMGDDESPQPDLDLVLQPEKGGRARRRGRFIAGAAELTVEVCFSSTAYDLHQKLELYERTGVREYLAVLLHEKAIRWNRLVGGRYRELRGCRRTAPLEGVPRSMARWRGTFQGRSS